jgi:hypothetical protein
MLGTLPQSLLLFPEGRRDEAACPQPCRPRPIPAAQLLGSPPDGDQHCHDHDSSGGMRKSGCDVDDAGDASEAEIRHLFSEGAGFRFWPIRAPIPGGGRHESPRFVLMR